jgi:hypothetical protein
MDPQWSAFLPGLRPAVRTPGRQASLRRSSDAKNGNSFVYICLFLGTFRHDALPAESCRSCPVERARRKDVGRPRWGNMPMLEWVREGFEARYGKDAVK